MATEGCGECCYAVINNIPAFYHSVDLRNFFSQSVESGHFQCFHFRHRSEKQTTEKEENSKETSLQNVNKSESSKTTCCVIRLTRHNFYYLCQKYNNNNWLDKNGDILSTTCHMSQIQFSTENKDNQKELEYKTKVEMKNIPEDRVKFTESDLLKLPELHPPQMMPHGNIGTPTKTFLQYIQECRLPPKIIQKLGLKFPRTKPKKLFGTVPFDYTQISSHGTQFENTNMETEDDDDGCEEWERHEANYDDPSNKARNKERLFEEKIELKWEKGGSGLVFYTDAQYWKKFEGDFDEQCADDWDVDMSCYYEEGGGDKDSKDLVTMRQEKRRRKGIEATDRYTDTESNSKIGRFEKHTKGFGRKIMEKQGWSDGNKLGSSSSTGLVEALENDGQNPQDKKGFGYYGEKLQRFQPSVRKIPKIEKNEHLITTVYDNPAVTDPDEPLLRRNEPYIIKHRPSVGHIEFLKGIDS
ncbi:hypothetical protein LOTGIDRAFT_207744 [Lottia gigantea]|uniref:G-patch domain-containing protein n=1 Tax=Lottia gigantea TaxID=225164 RepID=V4CFY0_LOTGI|nr:hypothetical protein LOTGIDRAFT_207744 [Lottia gigantea]ESP00950.1 hypothetical protein LOTGIDRAFT_207744 [Lottia gigantea]